MTATAADAHDPGHDEIQLVVFRLGAAHYAADILQLRRILPWEPPVPQPDAPPFVAGTVTWEGRALPVVDLRARLGLPVPCTEETRIVVLDLGREAVGVVVDAVRQVVRVDSTTITAADAAAHGLPPQWVAGLLARPERDLLVLNPQRFLAAEERQALRALEPVP
jgi:purine-binding chemotaxis protein CheW